MKAVDEAEVHDPEVLLHHYAQRDIDVLFPNIVPPPQDVFLERDMAGRDPAFVDPIKEPYVIRVHRPHRLTTDETTPTTDRAVDIDHDLAWQRISARDPSHIALNLHTCEGRSAQAWNSTIELLLPLQLVRCCY